MAQRVGVGASKRVVDQRQQLASDRVRGFDVDVFRRACAIGQILEQHLAVADDVVVATEMDAPDEIMCACDIWFSGWGS